MAKPGTDLPPAPKPPQRLPGAKGEGLPEDRVLTWYKRLESESNERFLPLFADEHRYLVLMGGGGSGKSIFAGRKVIERCVCEPGHRFLVCRKVARALRESCFRQLVTQARGAYPQEIESVNRTEMGLRFRNGSEILFAGLDDVEKLKSIYSITGIWIEEASELLEGDFNQLDIRLRGETTWYKQIILTFNPISILHWLKRRFFDTPDERVRTHRSTYRDNRFLDEDARQVLEAYRDTDEYYYTVYCLGEWGVTGRTVFPAKLVAQRLALNLRPETVGYFDQDGRFTEDDGGPLKVYARPKAGRHYVIGCDTAGDGSDWFVAQVLDNRTGEQAAVLRQQTDEDLFARQAAALGRWYNTALIGVEVNFSTHPVRVLEQMQYPRQYVRETLDVYTHKPKPAFGFRTDERTRNTAISGLIRKMREDLESVCDRDTLEEMLTFVRNEHFRPEAQAGAHDDCIMALAIAEYIRPQQAYEDDLPEAKRLPWRPDQWEDYNNAPEQLRRELLRIWGAPEP